MSTIENQIAEQKAKLQKLLELQQQQQQVAQQLQQAADELNDQKQLEQQQEQLYKDSLAELLKEVEEYKDFTLEVEERTKLLEQVSEVNKKINQKIARLKHIFSLYRRLEFQHNFTKANRSEIEFNSLVNNKFVELTKLDPQMIGSFIRNTTYFV